MQQCCPRSAKLSTRQVASERQRAKLFGMDRFSFVMVLLSIIVGLGVTEILTNIARQIQERRTSKFYWLHAVLVALVFVALLQQWWESWDQRAVESWTFPILLLMLGGPIGIYIISHLLYPASLKGADYRAHYYESPRITYIIAAIAVIFAGTYRPISFGHNLIDPDNIATAIVLMVFLILVFTKRKIVHEILVPLLFAVVLMDVLLFHWAI
jgi:hypothetical protein